MEIGATREASRSVLRPEEKDREETEAELYRQIGQFKVELDWLKKI